MSLNKFSFLQLSTKSDIIFIIFLVVATFFTTSHFLENHGQVMVDQDSYMHFENAMSIATDTQTSDRKLPATESFVLYLSLLYRLVQDPLNALMYLRLINLFATVQLVVFFYLIARKMFNPFFSLAGAIMALFMPISMAYSGTLESNVFASAMGFASLYFSIKPGRLSRLIPATIFIILTSARLDELMVFSVPYFIGVAYYISHRFHIKFSIILVIIIITFFVPVYFVIQGIGGIYSKGFFHQSILEQIFTLVSFDTIKTVVLSSIEITGENAENIVGNEELNKFYLGILLIGIIFFAFNYKKAIRKILTLKSDHFGEGSTTVCYLVIIILVSIFSLSAFHIPFNVVHDQIVINDEILPRYMIDLRIFLLYGFTYGVSLVSTVYQKVTNIIIGHNGQSIYEKSSPKIQNDFISLDLKNTVASPVTKKVFKIGRCFSYIFVIFILVLFSNAMWDSAVRFYGDLATQLQIHHDATQWLSKNLGENEKAFLPMPQTFGHWILH